MPDTTDDDYLYKQVKQGFVDGYIDGLQKAHDGYVYFEVSGHTFKYHRSYPQIEMVLSGGHYRVYVSRQSQVDFLIAKTSILEAFLLKPLVNLTHNLTGYTI